jgi:uncharacterized protein (TIGR02996 family)
VDDEEFLDALADHPDDEHYRLAYADWLEENGDPRGEFLRVESLLRSTPLGDPSRQGLGRRWRELRASLDGGWQVRIAQSSPAPWWLPPEARRPGRVGVRDFDREMSRSHWEWVILAVLAPIDAVARALIETRAGAEPEASLASGRWLRDVPTRRGRTGDRVSSLVPVIQLKGHAWTVAMYDTFNLSMPSYLSAQVDAQRLSDRLGTMAIEFSTEDTSGATGYHLFECGELAEYAEWGAGSDCFASKRRPRLPWPEFPRDYPEELFRECGLYLPAFYAGEGRSGPCLALDAPAVADVGRADLLDIRGDFREGGAMTLPEIRAEFVEFHVLQDEDFGEGPWGDDAPNDDAGEEDIPF